jgi:hypothetical protein
MWQTASDFLVFLGWFWQNTILILENVFAPIQYIYTFLYQFFIFALKSPTAFQPIWNFPRAIIDLFYSVPYFNVLIESALVGITIIFVMYILRTFLKT